jgi:hypothetical protein
MKFGLMYEISMPSLLHQALLFCCRVVVASSETVFKCLVASGLRNDADSGSSKRSTAALFPPGIK